VKKYPVLTTKSKSIPNRKTYQNKMIRAMNKRIGVKDAIPRRNPRGR
jgi:hypothetical protein